MPGGKLVYEGDWGGVVARGTLESFWIDFGAGWYNDHHFHYMYVFYAAAVVANLRAAWRRAAASRTGTAGCPR